MKLEDQVVSVELAKRLKEVGVKQESYFYWWDGYQGYGYDGKQKWRELPVERTEVGLGFPDRTLFWDKNCSAFTVAELGEMLPSTLWGKPYDIEHYVYDNPRLYGIQAKTYTPSVEGTVEQTHFQVSEASEADARAKMLIYLLENKLVKP